VDANRWLTLKGDAIAFSIWSLGSRICFCYGRHSLPRSRSRFLLPASKGVTMIQA
jgi:hypothetical protein